MTFEDQADPADRFRELMAKARTGRARTWEPVTPTPGTIGECVERSLRAASFTSRNEDRIARDLETVGFPVDRLSVRVPDLIAGGDTTWLCTPDLVVGTVAVEVDYPTTRGGGPSHEHGWPAEDLYRDDCLRAAGYTVARVRLGGLAPVLGAHNVLWGGGLTRAVRDATVVTVRAAVAGAPATNITVERSDVRETR